MAIDSRQKRMSAMNLASPWRGPLVDATEAGFTQGNRAAACWLYSGIAAEVSSTPPNVPGIELAVPRSVLHFAVPRSVLHFAQGDD